MNKANKILANRSSLRSKLLEVQKTIPFQSVAWKKEWNCSFFGMDWYNISSLEGKKGQEGLAQRLCHLAETERIELDRGTREDSEDEECLMTIDLDEDGEQEESEDEIICSKKRRTEHEYSPLSFCITRWYSAWTVMTRFYGLWDAIMALPEFCGTDSNDKTDLRDLVAAAEGLEKNDLFNVISFLKPLVEGIDYCQRDDIFHLNVGEMLQSVFSFYEEHSGDKRGRE